MRLHALREKPAPELASMLAEFEAQFTYPLGAGQSFSISHGEDYPRFFRAMGNATCFIAEQENRVVGALGVAVRALTVPDGSQRQAAYIGDLKVSPGAAGSMVFLRLARAADSWARPQVGAAYGVVMDGTRASPAQYTGRVGIPAFLQLDKLNVVRFECPVISPAATDDGSQLDVNGAAADLGINLATDQQGAACFAHLSQGQYASRGGTPTERSEMAPLWLIDRDGAACGRLEDTRRAKRLIGSDGIEIISMHLSCFAWRAPADGARLIHAARRHAALCGLAALFVAVADRHMPALDEALGSVDRVVAPATVYGVGIPRGPAWNINTSEI